MSENHALLQAMTVSLPELDQLVQVAIEAGALGAKLSGAGRGGNMIALVEVETAAMVRAALLASGAGSVLSTTISDQ
jgi:mevalonate kinase